MEPLVIAAGFLAYKAFDEAVTSMCGKMREQLLEYLKKKYPRIYKPLDNAKKTSEKVDLNLIALALEEKMKDDEELKKLVISLGQELEKNRVMLDNRKIVNGNDYSGTFSSQRDINFGEVTYKSLDDEGVKKKTGY